MGRRKQGRCGTDSRNKHACCRFVLPCGAGTCDYMRSQFLSFGAAMNRQAVARTAAAIVKPITGSAVRPIKTKPPQIVNRITPTPNFATPSTRHLFFFTLSLQPKNIQKICRQQFYCVDRSMFTAFPATGPFLRPDWTPPANAASVVIAHLTGITCIAGVLSGGPGIFSREIYFSGYTG